jgi:bifunctional non-homologous end joining protein LigD
VRPTFVRPLVPANATRPPRGPGWLFEPKLDGFRLQILKDGDCVRLFSKGGAEYSDRLPGMVESFKRLPTRSAILDGELCSIGADGRPRFYKLLHDMRTRWPDEDQMMFFVFDLLYQDGVDLRHLPLSERKRDLDRLCRRSRLPSMKQVQTFPDGDVLFEHCAKFGFEGVVAKRVDRPYYSGPSKTWTKTKCPGWKRENQERFKAVRRDRALTHT